MQAWANDGARHRTGMGNAAKWVPRRRTARHPSPGCASECSITNAQWLHVGYSSRWIGAPGAIKAERITRSPPSSSMFMHRVVSAALTHSNACSHLRPSSQQVVINPRQADHYRIVRSFLRRQPLHIAVALKEQRTSAVVTHHALNPEKRRHAHAARDRRHMVQTRRRVKHHVPRRQLGPMHSERILDAKLAAVVCLGLFEKKRRRQVAANAEIRAAQLPDRVI